MSVTVEVLDNPSVRLTAVDVGAVPPDTVEFTVEGTVTVSAGLLESFEGSTLRPVAVAATVDGSTVVVDIGEAATLQIESIDVDVETPGGVPEGADELRSAEDLSGVGDDASEATDAGAVAFAVEGTIAGVSADAFETLSGGQAEPESITFALEDEVSTDGGSDDVVFEVTVLGYGIVVRLDGSITIRRT